MHIIETIAHCNLHCQSKHRSNITKDSSFSVACFSHMAHGVRLFEITCCQPLQQLIYLRRSRKGCSRELTAATSTELPSCSEARAVPSKKKEKCAYMEAEEVGRPCEKQSNTNRTNDRPTLRNRHGFGLFDMLTWSAASLYPLKVLFPVHPPLPTPLHCYMVQFDNSHFDCRNETTNQHLEVNVFDPFGFIQLRL